MAADILLITPPFTQLNTPYPATAYLKGFLNTKNISSYQCDLGIEVTLQLFSKQGLTHLFSSVDITSELTPNAKRIFNLQEAYITIIDAVVQFLQGSNPTLAHQICKKGFLPEAGRFVQTADLIWAFGNMGIQDKAKHLATLFLEDLSDFIKECIDEHFGFSRYAEKLGRSAANFDELYNSLQKEYSFIDRLLIELLQQKIKTVQPKLVALSIPFPGNLYAGLRCGKWIKENHPEIKIALGGGFANTELRSLSDARVFEFIDFVSLDDGETPIENLWQYINGHIEIDSLKRTFTSIGGTVSYINNSACGDYKQAQIGTPDYSDLLLDKYISAIEIINPMHSLWSDGRWNKLTMAHGCYWGKCTFCDISLDYIKNYEPLTAQLLCDRMEQLIAQTGQTGFHFVDEAAPPALMRALALEIINRKLTVSWWTNIRFEKSFTRDLCLLLKASGCIGVSGGLEVASDRLLQLIQKGITVAQVARVNKNFTEAGIMVHAYLMYGFPTQTAQETIDSLEMVRQMFEAGILQSAYWHLFTMTAHSPVGMNPEKYKVQKQTSVAGSFANNDIEHIDPTGADHEAFSFGLKKSLLNYMHGACFDMPLHKWFDAEAMGFKIPRTIIAPDFIKKCLEDELVVNKPSAKITWLGKLTATEKIIKTKKGSSWEMWSLTFQTKTTEINIKVNEPQGSWLAALLTTLSNTDKIFTLQEIKEDYEKNGWDDFELFWDNKPVNTLFRAGLLQV